MLAKFRWRCECKAPRRQTAQGAVKTPRSKDRCRRSGEGWASDDQTTPHRADVAISGRAEIISIA